MASKVTMYSALYDEFHPFQNLFDNYKRVLDPSDLNDGPGFLVIWGGADISPSIYHSEVNKLTGATATPSSRDRLEINLANAAVDLGMLVVGVCRGAQLMCALTGGKLVQHVSGHNNPHMITTREGGSLASSSLHHQMMYPWDLEYELIAWSSRPLSPIYDGETLRDQLPPRETKGGVLAEPEILYLPKTKALCIQGHPEYGQIGDPLVVYCNNLIKEYLG